MTSTNPTKPDVSPFQNNLSLAVSMQYDYMFICSTVVLLGAALNNKAAVTQDAASVLTVQKGRMKVTSSAVHSMKKQLDC